MLRTIVTFLLLVGSISLYGQNGYWQTGASETAQANASAGLKDGAIMFHNIGALARVQYSSVSVGYDYRTFVDGLNNVNLQLIAKGKNQNIGLGFFKSGDDIYNEFVASAGIARQLGIAGLGIKINYYQTFSEAFGYHRNYSVSAGGITELFPDFFWGTYIENAFQLKNSDVKMHVPVIFASGLSYLPTSNLVLSITGSMNIDEPLHIKTGLAYEIIPELTLRTGVNWYYRQAHYGLGFNLKRMLINYAFTPVNRLGAMHSVTLQLIFNKKDQE